MSSWLVALATVIYAAVAAEQALKENWPMCIVYAGYAFANVGLILAVK